MDEETWWFHMNSTHGSYNGVVNGLRGKFQNTRPNHTLSINDNVDNTQSLIKIVTETGWYESPQGNFIRNSPSLTLEYTPETHDQARTMVTDTAWTGEQTR